MALTTLHTTVLEKTIRHYTTQPSGILVINLQWLLFADVLTFQFVDFPGDNITRSIAPHDPEERHSLRIQAASDLHRLCSPALTYFVFKEAKVFITERFKNLYSLALFFFFFIWAHNLIDGEYN